MKLHKGFELIRIKILKGAFKCLKILEIRYFNTYILLNIFRKYNLRTDFSRPHSHHPVRFARFVYTGNKKKTLYIISLSHNY